MKIIIHIILYKNKLKMSILTLFFGNSINPFLWYFIVSLIVAILITLLDMWLFNLIPNFIKGIAWLIVLIMFILWIARNTVLNLWSTDIGKAVLIAIVFVLAVVILTSQKVAENVSKIGKKVSKK